MWFAPKNSATPMLGWRIARCCGRIATPALALAAVRTKRIQLGTGVAITGTRPAPNNASGIATINALAPGRTFFGVGAGNTAMRVNGLAAAAHRTVRPVSDHRGAALAWRRGGTSSSRQSTPHPAHHGRMKASSTSPTPSRCTSPASARNPWRSPAKHGDGAVLALPATPGVMENIWRHDRGWCRASWPHRGA